MMRVIKWIGIALGSLLGLLIVALIVLAFAGRSRINAQHEIAVETVAIPTDEAAVERGKHIVNSVASCTSCHGPSLEGEAFIDGMPIGRVVASNLTAGAGGVGARYSDEDWVRALRHGVGDDGKSLLPMMPVDSYHHMSGADLGATIAYLKSVPPVDSELEPTGLAFTGNIILGVLSFGDFPVSYLADAPAPAAETPSGVSVEHGEYLAWLGSCRHCHGADLNGGQVDPDALIGPNLTPGGHLGQWSETDFINTMRTGLRPDGSAVDPFMPWPNFGGMSDEELQSIWAYLQSLEPLASAME